MIHINSESLKDKINELYNIGQGHIFNFWDEITDEQRALLLNQINNLDIELLQQLIPLGTGSEKQVVHNYKLEPVDVVTCGQRKELDEKMRPAGEKALRDGKVAAFLVAGGQGSRLGFEGPKGCFPITPVKNKTLFQLHAEKILAATRKYNTVIPWYIMTSDANHTDTNEFFAENKYFGLGAENVHFFSQDMLPAIDRNGKLLLSQKYKIFESPNGHGGSIKALWDSGSLGDMEERGIEYIYYFQVDNVLLNICDPVFIGYHIINQSEMSNKVVRKSSPEDKVGVICKINGKTGVVEYSDLSRRDKYAVWENGSLKYWAGSIAIHIISRSFLERENKNGFRLPYHVAEKNIPFIDEKGNRINPEGKNGIKFETFVFDALLDAEKTFTIEIAREDEFSAVKNSSGTESPATARNDLLQIYRRWFREAGIEPGAIKKVEISPLFATEARDVREKKGTLPEIVDGLYIE